MKEGSDQIASRGFSHPIGGFCVFGGNPMSTEGFKRKLSAILSGNYSRLMGEDDDATVRTPTGHREMMFTLIRQHQGQVFDSPGDNLLAELESVLQGMIICHANQL